MLESYKKQQMAISTVLCQRGKPQMCLDGEETEKLDNIVNVLAFYFETTKEVSGEKYSTSSKVIPLVRQLKRLTGANKTTLARRLDEQLLHYFDDLEDQEALTLATILDPRFKSKCFSSKNKTLLEQALKDKMATEVVVTGRQSDEQEGSSVKYVKESEEKRKVSLWDDFDEEVENEKNAPSSKSEVDIEFLNYLELPLIPRINDPLAWWKAHEQAMPRLSKLAKKYLSIPATSVPSERLFSKAGELISARRANLKPSNVDMILFLNRR